MHQELKCDILTEEMIYCIALFLLPITHSTILGPSVFRTELIILYSS